MKKLIVLLFFILLPCACGQAPERIARTSQGTKPTTVEAATVEVTRPVIESATTSPSLTPTSTQKVLPTRPNPEGCTSNPSSSYTETISGIVKGDPLELRITGRFAGAIDSLTWRGKEFINNWDHGREIAYAWGMNDLGECLNPTEPGSANDGARQSPGLPRD